ncbi:MAG: hypothetical protein M3Z30_10365 [Gemmatimonadota bacterium]|nr:hypothetical protein [Gemmatimonadota bacterium]
MVDAPPLRALALRTLAFTHHAARDWLSLGQSVADVRQIEQCYSDSASVHDELELCSLNARRYSSREQGETLRLAKECISSLAANPAHRVAAAIIALKVATNVGDLEGMDEVHKSVGPYLDDPSVSATNRISLLMIYHAIRGDAATAAILARDLLGIVQTSLSPVHQLVPMMDCAGALRRAGAPGEACRIYRDIFELAKKSHVMDMAADAAHRCIEISCDAADFATASEWIDRYYATTAANYGGSVHYSLRGAIARVRISERNWREADELLEPAGCAPLWSDPVAMFRNSAIAVKLRLELDRGTPADEIAKWVHDLAKSHASLRDTGAQDYEAYSLFLGYRAIGDAASAIDMLRSYVASQRRDITPLCAEIQRALANYA